MTSGLPDYHGYLVEVRLPPGPDIGNPQKYEGSVATVGAFATLDVNEDLGRNAGDGYIMCDGPGDLEVDISWNGVDLEEDITVEKNEALSLAGMNVDTIRIDATEDGTSYRVLVI